MTQTSRTLSVVGRLPSPETFRQARSVDSVPETPNLNDVSDTPPPSAVTRRQSTTEKRDKYINSILPISAGDITSDAHPDVWGSEWTTTWRNTDARIDPTADANKMRHGKPFLERLMRVWANLEWSRAIAPPYTDEDGTFPVAAFAIYYELITHTRLPMPCFYTNRSKAGVVQQKVDRWLLPDMHEHMGLSAQTLKEKSMLIIAALKVCQTYALDFHIPSMVFTRDLRIYGCTEGAHKMSFAMRPRIRCKALATALELYFRRPEVLRSQTQLDFTVDVTRLFIGSPIVQVLSSAASASDPLEDMFLLGLGDIGDLAELQRQSVEETRKGLAYSHHAEAKNTPKGLITHIVSGKRAIKFCNPPRLTGTAETVQRSIARTESGREAARDSLLFWAGNVHRNRYAAAQKFHIVGVNPDTELWECYLCTAAAPTTKLLSRMWRGTTAVSGRFRRCPGWQPLQDSRAAVPVCAPSAEARNTPRSATEIASPNGAGVICFSLAPSCHRAAVPSSAPSGTLPIHAFVSAPSGASNFCAATLSSASSSSFAPTPGRRGLRSTSSTNRPRRAHSISDAVPRVGMARPPAVATSSCSSTKVSPAAPPAATAARLNNRAEARTATLTTTPTTSRARSSILRRPAAANVVANSSARRVTSSSSRLRSSSTRSAPGGRR